MLDRFVGRAVFSDGERIVGEQENRGDLFHRGHAKSGFAIIAENEERGAIRDEAAVKGHAIDRGRHRKFADAEMDIPAFPVFRGENAASFHGRLRGTGDVRRTPDAKGH